jgi:hypothetical protein
MIFPEFSICEFMAESSTFLRKIGINQRIVIDAKGFKEVLTWKINEPIVSQFSEN